MRYRIKGPENSKSGAQAYEAVLRQKLARGEDILKKTGDDVPTFETFSTKWFSEYVVPNNKQQEQRTKMYALRSSLIPYFGKKRIDQITTYDIERYKAACLEKGLARKTVNNRLGTLRKCIVTAHDWQQVSGSLPKFTPLKCPPPQTDYLSADECALLLSKSEGAIREVILLALRTGMRQGEIRGLQWSSINWENRIITVRHSLNDRMHQLESPKSNRERYIPIDIDVYELLFKRKKDTGYVFISPDNGPYDSQRLLRQLHKVRHLAGLREFGWHMLRHTFATQLTAKGAPIAAVQSLLGHSTIVMTMRYAHVAPSTLRTAIDLLNPRMAANTNFGHQLGTGWIHAEQKEVMGKTQELKIS